MSGALCTCSSRTPLIPLPLVDIGELLLAVLLERPALLDEVPGLVPDDFNSYRLALVFSAMRNVQARGEAVSVESVDNYLAEIDVVRGTVCQLHAGRRYMAALARVNPVPNSARTAARVRAWAVALRVARWQREQAIRAEVTARAEITP